MKNTVPQPINSDSRTPIAEQTTASRGYADSETTAGRGKGWRSRSRPRGYVETWTPQPQTELLLANILAILEQYLDLWPLTVRQVFYRLVGAYFYAKTENAYGNLCETMSMARRARRIPFEAIRDDGTSRMAYEDFADMDAFHRMVNEMARSYQRDKLARQPYHIELWTEAAGMQPQLARVAAPYSVPVYSSGGFNSLDAKWKLAQRIVETGKPSVVLHVGDLDPSGVAIFDAVAGDVGAFVEADRKWRNVTVEFVRVALTPEQVEEYQLATAPPKESSHSKRWGGAPTCQLEALAPTDLATIVHAAITAQFDQDILAEDRALETGERRQLTRLLPAPRSAS